MRRAFVGEIGLAGRQRGEQVQLPPDAAHHLERVLRLLPGTPVELFDGEGLVAGARLLGGGIVELDGVAPAPALLPPLVVAQAAVRGPKLEEVVRRGTELGASAFQVFQAERSNTPAPRLDRLERVVQQAARQAERAQVPSLTGPSTFSQLVDEVRAARGVVVVGALGAPRALSEVLADHPHFRGEGMMVVIGPEGGLAPRELRDLEEAGAVTVRLGVHVLRTETASLAALACAQAALATL
ncbi:MAG: RsmE family RNA methyltransferase [Myxococcota bacterium]